MLLQKPNLVIYGDVLTEVFAKIQSMPKLGQDSLVNDLTILPGGSAANCAAISAKLGTQVSFIGISGRDLFGAMLRQDLVQHGVNVKHLRHVDGSTATVITLIDPSAERTFFSFRGVAALLPYGPLPNPVLGPDDILHISGYSFQTTHSRQTALDLIETARQVGARVSIDPSFHFASKVVTEYPNVLSLDYFFPNQEEAFLITQTQDSTQAASRLLEIGIKTVLLKLGAAGCLVAHEKRSFQFDAFPQERIIDTTGAGDAFAAGFLSAILKGCALEEAALVGQATASVIITKVGGHTAAPTKQNLIDFANKNKDKKLLDALAQME